jgi:triacylglycerol lipase
MRKPIPSRLSFDLLPPVTDPRIHRYFEHAPANPFRPGAQGLDLCNAWWLAELSLLSFAAPGFVEAELLRAGLAFAGPPLEGPSSVAYAALGAGFAVVAFRGTQVFRLGRDPLSVLGEVADDVLTDVEIPLVPAGRPSRGRVHRGFRNALDEIWKPLHELVASLRRDDPGRALWLTGHSLGGALAILAAARLPEVQGVYVFGAPHVGDAEFRAALPAVPVRFIHGNDLVTRVPVVALNLPPRIAWDNLVPRVDLLGTYRPVGHTLAFDRNGRIVLNPDPDGAAEALRDELRRLDLRQKDWARQQPLDDVIDHAPLFYAVHLWNLYDESFGRTARWTADDLGLQEAWELAGSHPSVS